MLICFILFQDVNFHVQDYIYNSIISLSILDCGTVELHFECVPTKIHANLKQLHIVNCFQLDLSITNGDSLQHIPSNVSFENISFVHNISGYAFGDYKGERCYIGHQEHVERILFKNVTIGQIDHNAFYNLHGIKEFIFDNIVVRTIKERAFNNIVMGVDGVFVMNNSNIYILCSNAVNVNSPKFIFSQNEVNELHSNGLNITAEQVIIQRNNFSLIKPEAFGIVSNCVEITYNDFDLIKTSAFMNIKTDCRNGLSQYTFSYNKVRNVEIGSLYFDRSTFESSDKQMDIKHNMINCVCSRLAWLYFYPYLGDAFNIVTELNDKLLSLDNNNTCLDSPCYLPLSIIKIVIVNNMCHLAAEARMMCYLYYDKTIRNISAQELELNSHYKKQTGLSNLENYDLNLGGFELNVTEPAPAFYVIKPRTVSRHNLTSREELPTRDGLNESRNTQGKLENIALQDSSVDKRNVSSQQRDIIDGRIMGLVSYMRTLNISNATIDKILNKDNNSTPASQREPHASSEGVNFQSISKCFDKESCSRYVQENKQRALDFYKYLYSQLRPVKYNPQGQT